MWISISYEIIISTYQKPRVAPPVAAAAAFPAPCPLPRVCPAGRGRPYIRRRRRRSEEEQIWIFNEFRRRCPKTAKDFVWMRTFKLAGDESQER